VDRAQQIVIVANADAVVLAEGRSDQAAIETLADRVDCVQVNSDPRIPSL
jgi:5S rRNA maturation endonuclease (ribonuclease M5)